MGGVTWGQGSITGQSVSCRSENIPLTLCVKKFSLVEDLLTSKPSFSSVMTLRLLISHKSFTKQECQIHNIPFTLYYIMNIFDLLTVAVESRQINK